MSADEKARLRGFVEADDVASLEAASRGLDAAELAELYMDGILAQAMAAVSWLEANGAPDPHRPSPAGISYFELPIHGLDGATVSRAMAQWLVHHIPQNDPVARKMVQRFLAEAPHEDLRMELGESPSSSRKQRQRFDRLMKALVDGRVTSFRDMVAQGAADDLDIPDVARSAEAYLRPEQLEIALGALERRGLWSAERVALTEDQLVEFHDPPIDAEGRTEVDALVDDVLRIEGEFEESVLIRFRTAGGAYFFYRGSARSMIDVVDAVWVEREGRAQRPARWVSMTCSFKRGKLGGHTVPLAQRPRKVTHALRSPVPAGAT